MLLTKPLIPISLRKTLSKQIKGQLIVSTEWTNLKDFPNSNDPNNKWVSSLELNEAGLKGMDSTYTKSVLPLYYGSLNNASQSNNIKMLMI
jgi:hypothetical protein